MADQAQALRRMVAECGLAATRSARLIPVIGGQPGAGATTVAYLLAHGLTLQGSRVVLADVVAGPPHDSLPQRMGVANGAPVPRDSWHQRLNLCDLLLPGPDGMLLLPGPQEELARNDWPVAATTRWVNGLADLTPVTDWIVVDVGVACQAHRWAPLLQSADEICLVTTVDSGSIMDTYALLKHLVRTGGRKRCSLLINCCGDLSQATDVHRRMAHSCQRFLGIHLHWGGRIGHDAQLSPETMVFPPEPQSSTRGALRHWIDRCHRRTVGGSLPGGAESNIPEANTLAAQPHQKPNS